MKILVANLGSTSFKYRLFDMDDERQLARGGVERIGAAESQAFVEIGGERRELVIEAPDHAAAVRQCLAQLTDPDYGCLDDPADVAGIGFKTVHGGRVGGVRLVDEEVLAAMEEVIPVAPAHNPPYIAAMRLLGEKLPEIPLVAAFETGFHAHRPLHLKMYATPRDWAEGYLVQKWGFHGASHRYIAGRTAELKPQPGLRVISLHLGGSSSLTAIKDGHCVQTTMGASPQSGLPQNNRVGDIDPFALLLVMKATGQTFEETLETLSSQGGLLGLSGVSGDIRDIEEAAAAGNENAQLALDVYTSEIRRHLGGLLVEMGGVDMLAFTGGIGENDSLVRAAVCKNLAELGIVLDETKNENAKGEGPLHAAASRCEIWIVPTNEEIVVARQTKEVLEELG